MFFYDAWWLNIQCILHSFHFKDILHLANLSYCFNILNQNEKTFAFNETILEEINHNLSRFIYRLDHFSYYLGDSLFDTFVSLLHFCYTLAKIQGIENHFGHCLYRQHDAPLKSLQIELTPDFLRDLHNVNDVEMYLEIFSTPSSICAPSLITLWGDSLCIKWFSNILSTRVNFWLYAKQ